jgi:hypothetical protein
MDDTLPNLGNLNLSGGTVTTNAEGKKVIRVRKGTIDLGKTLFI